MKRLYCSEKAITKWLFLVACFHWSEWFIPICLDIDSMAKEDFTLSLKVLCFSLHIIFCWS